MATKTRIVGWNPNAFLKEVTDNAIEFQNQRLVEYAEQKIRLLGDAIQLYNSTNHMDASGNLLDSLCWGVCYNGQLVGSGFYREKTATDRSMLHELTKVQLIEGSGRSKWRDLYGASKKEMESAFSEMTAGEPVDGRRRAEVFIEKESKNSKSGQWKVFFAILAPYWGYWEKGHHNVFTKKFEQFAVMTQFYDRVKEDLKPARTRIRVSVAKYASKSLVRQAKKNIKEGNRKIQW